MDAWVYRLWLEHHATEPWLYRLGYLCARAVELVVVVTVSLRPGVGLRLTTAVVSLQRVYIYQQPRGLATWAMLLIACMYAILA